MIEIWSLSTMDKLSLYISLQIEEYINVSGQILHLIYNSAVEQLHFI